MIQFLLPILVASFFAIVFTQSALDKIFNYAKNKTEMEEQFRKSFLSGSIGVFLPVITIAELLTGLANMHGLGNALFAKFTGGDLHHARIPYAVGFAMAGVVLLMLLFGQRVSKNYAGAVGLTGYFLIMLFGLLVLRA
jgi:hypothetical protein